MLSLWGVIACWGAGAAAQFDSLNAGLKSLQAGHRLQALELMRQAAQDNPALQQMLPQFLPAISDYSPQYPLEDTTASPVIHKAYWDSLVDSLQELKRADAIPTICELARHRQIVILNEAHDCPQHRAFAHRLALALREIGFESLAVETLAGKPGPVVFDYPTLATGHYSGEPVFADFLRQARSSGFQFMAYEAEPDKMPPKPRDSYETIRWREETQADNLVAHVLEPNPAARLLIYVGYSHATEDWRTLPDGRQVGWLAAQLRKRTGIDPLTLDQVGGSYNPQARQVDAVFKLLQDAAPLKAPLVVQHPDGSWLTSDAYQGKVDLTVFHPPQEMSQGRPNWLFMDGYRKAVEIAREPYYRGTPVLLQAFLAHEAGDGIPMDQLLITSDEGQATFLLPPGAYRLVTQDAAGNHREHGMIQVAD